MKRLILLLVILLPLYTMAQDVTISSMMKEYSAKEKCTTINLSSSMLRSMGVEMGADNLRAISIEDSALVPRFEGQVQSVVAGLDAIMSVSDNGKSVEIYQRTNGYGRVSDLVIFVKGCDECVLMHIHGKDLELSKAGSLIEF